MDRNFARALALVLKSEGGWSDIPADPGGATMKGVTLATFRAYIKPGGTKAELRAITDDQLSACYRKEYWDAVAGDDLPDGVDYATFDFGVNSGPGRAAKYLQAAVGVPQDGAIGPATLAAVKAKPAGVVIDTLCDARLAFLKRLPTWATFGKGWQSRVASVRAQALLLTSQPATAAPPAPAAPIQPAPPVTAQEPSIPAAPSTDRPSVVITPAPAHRSGIIAFLILLLSMLATFFHKGF